MTAVADAKTIMNILRGTTSTDQELLRIADRFIAEAGSAWNPADPQNPTNEEKALLFISMLREYGRDVVERQTRIAQRASAKAAEDASAATALNDL